MKIGEFFVQLGVKADTTTVKSFGKAIADLPLDVAAAITALAGIEYHLGKVAMQAMETASSFQTFTSETGLSYQELQRWQAVAEMVNVSADTMTSSINALQRNIAEIRLGRGNIAPFQLLGIGVNQNAFGVLQQLRERIKGLDPATATNMISAMGLSPDMIKVLRLSDAELQKFTAHVTELTDKHVADFLKAKQALVGFGQQFRYTMFGVVAHFTEAIEKSMQFRKIIVGVGIALAALAIYFFPVTAAIVGLLLVLDDLAVYFTGGKSVFGLIVDGFKKLGKEIGDAFSSVTKFGALTAQLLAAGVIPGMGVSVAQGLAAGAVGNKTVNQTVHMTVHGSGPAHETATAVRKEIDRASAAAALQSNNQGH